MSLQVQLVSPERILYEGDADMVIVRTRSDGDLAFLPGHQPFLGALRAWPVRLISSDGEQVFAVHGGFAQVDDDRVIILSDVAELPSDIDAARALVAREHAESILALNSDDEEAREALDRANIRLQVAATLSHPER